METPLLFIGQAALQVSQSLFQIIPNASNDASSSNFKTKVERTPLEPSVPSILIDSDSVTINATLAAIFHLPAGAVPLQPLPYYSLKSSNIKVAALKPSCGSGNNFACGYDPSNCPTLKRKAITNRNKFNTIPADAFPKSDNEAAINASQLIDTLSFLRQSIEQNENSHSACMLFTYATAGGTGAGFSARLAETIRELYPKAVIVAIPIWPFWDCGDTCTAAYNTILNTAWMQEYADMLLVMENEALQYDEAASQKANAVPSRTIYTVALKEAKATRCLSKSRIHSSRDTIFDNINNRISVTLLHLFGNRLPTSATSPSNLSSKRTPQTTFNSINCAKSVFDMMKLICPVPSAKLVAPFCSYFRKHSSVASSCPINSEVVYQNIADTLLKQVLFRRQNAEWYYESKRSSGYKHNTRDMYTKVLDHLGLGLTLSAKIVYRSEAPKNDTVKLANDPRLKFVNALCPIWSPTQCIHWQPTDAYIREIELPSLGAAVNWKPLSWNLHAVLENAERKLKHRIYLHHYEACGFGLPVFIEALERVHDVVDTYKMYC